MQYPSKFQKICYWAQRIYGILWEGSACELNSFGHEQNPSDSSNQNNWPMVFVDYPNEGIIFLLSFGMAMQYLSRFQYICDGVQRIFSIPQKMYYTCIE
jgi:hypothetical protein